jgi:GNAT superfamily N-acetyltransferase
MTVSIKQEAWDGADGVRLRDDMRSELAARYNIPDQEVEAPTAETVSVFLVARDPDGVAIACGALRVLDDGTGEVKRMYVSPHARGTGVATGVLRALEVHARQLGVDTLVLSTGTKQPDAIRFYEREGYRHTDGYGPYVGQPMARCFSIELA